MNTKQKIEWLQENIDNNLKRLKNGKTYVGVDLEDLIMKELAKLEQLQNPPDLSVRIEEGVVADEKIS